MLVPFLNDQGKANKADQDQTASAVRSGSSLFAVLTCKHFVNSSLDNQYFIWLENRTRRVIEILEHLSYEYLSYYILI